MALDLSQTVRQIDTLAQSLNSARDDRAQRLDHALRAMRESDASEVKRKVDSSRGRPFLCAGLYSDAEGLAARNAPEEVPKTSAWCRWTAPT